MIPGVQPAETRALQGEGKPKNHRTEVEGRKTAACFTERLRVLACERLIFK